MKKDIKFSTRMASADREKIRALAAKAHMSMSDYITAYGRSVSRIAIVHFVNYKRGTQSRAAMRGVMLYVMQEKKTTWEGGPLISGVNCQPQSVYDDFINTKLLYHKDGGVMFYHMVQSFPKGAAVDPRQAHESARRLAEYFDGCEVLV